MFVCSDNPRKQRWTPHLLHFLFISVYTSSIHLNTELICVCCQSLNNMLRHKLPEVFHWCMEGKYIFCQSWTRENIMGPISNIMSTSHDPFWMITLTSSTLYQGSVLLKWNKYMWNKCVPMYKSSTCLLACRWAAGKVGLVGKLSQIESVDTFTHFSSHTTLSG